MKYRVYYNTHQYEDCSDRPRSAQRTVEAPSEDHACEAVHNMRKAGSRFIGLVHYAEPLDKAKR
jgi:hypothetical protein